MPINHKSGINLIILNDRTTIIHHKSNIKPDAGYIMISDPRVIFQDEDSIYLDPYCATTLQRDFQIRESAILSNKVIPHATFAEFYMNHINDSEAEFARKLSEGVSPTLN